MRAAVSSVPFVPTTTVAPRPDAYSAISVKSSRSNGSPPDRMRSGAGFTARSSSTMRRAPVVSSSDAGAAVGPAEM